MQVKDHTVIEIGSCNPGCTMYTVCVLLRSLDVMEGRKKAVFYAIAHKNMLFSRFSSPRIFSGMLPIPKQVQ